MPFAVRRSDGKYLKKTTSRKEWVDDFEDASTWSGSGHASAAAKSFHSAYDVRDGAVIEYEVVQVERRVVGVTQAYRLTGDPLRAHKVISSKIPPLGGGGRFRVVDEG